MLTVMIVDDDSTTVEVLVDSLRADGINGVATAAGLLKRSQRAFTPDAYLIDLMLQDESGIELAQELRDRDVRVPIIGMTGSLYLAEIARESGVFDAVLEKPLDLAEVTLTVVEAIPEIATDVMSLEVGPDESVFAPTPFPIRTAHGGEF